MENGEHTKRSEKQIEHNFKLWILLVTSYGWTNTVFILFRQAFHWNFSYWISFLHKPTNIYLTANNLQCILYSIRSKPIWCFIVKMNENFWISFSRIRIIVFWYWLDRLVCIDEMIIIIITTWMNNLRIFGQLYLNLWILNRFII